MTVYIFPGQGSQRKGMGKNLFDEFPEITAMADSILGYSIKDLCVNDPNSELNLTQFTQPALYTVNALTYLKDQQENGIKPDYVAGHSLGEYSALFAAGVVSFETGLRLVQRRGALMGEAKGSGMAAVMNLNSDEIYDVIKENNLDAIDVANFNSPAQTIIAGLKEELEQAKDSFISKKEGVKYVMLKVSAAFHSRHMVPTKEQFGSFLNEFNFSKPEIPVIANITARPYKYEDIQKNLTEQITDSVQWTDTIRYLLAKGETEFKEIGPGRVLTGLVRAIKSDAPPMELN